MMENLEINDSANGCSMPPPLTDEELIAALDGEVSSSVKAHLGRCVFCSNRLKNISRTEQALHQVMYRTDCLPADQLADYVMNILPVTGKLKVETHLKTCVRCQQEVQALHSVFGSDLASELVSEPIQTPFWEKIAGTLKSVEAQIVRILVPQPLSANVTRKGQRGEQSRHILNYGNDTISVMLALEKVVEGLKIVGDIMDTEMHHRWSGSFVELISRAEDKKHYLAQVDDDDHFSFDSVAPGHFDLSVYAEDDQILRLQRIEIALK